jgi:hypothetical protein
MAAKWNEPPDKGDWLLGLLIFTAIVCAMIAWGPKL